MAEAVEKSKPHAKKPAKRYSEKQKANRLAKYQALQKSGMSALTAAKKVGVSYITLLKWQKGAGKKKPAAKARPKARPRPVARRKKPQTAKAGQLVLVTPEGLRIEGISARELIEVLQALK